eukprot:gene17840-18068_t
MKHPIHIDDLLVWAYRDQCVDRANHGFSAAGPSGMGTNILGAHMALGTRVDSSSFATNAVSDRTPEDALIIDQAVMRLGEMYLEWDGSDLSIWDAQRAAVAGYSILPGNGCTFLDKRGQGGALAEVERVVLTVLLISNARSNSAPEAHIDWVPPQPKARKRKIEGVGAYSVAYARSQYLVWHAALEVLAIQLDGALENWIVLGPKLPREPWLRQASCAVNDSKPNKFDANAMSESYRNPARLLGGAAMADTLQFDLSGVVKQMKAIGVAVDQMPFAISLSLNRAAKNARQVRNKGFIGAALRVDNASKRDLTVTITDAKMQGRGNLSLHADGGSKHAKSVLAIPSVIVKRGDVIYQRIGKGKSEKLKLMYVLKPSAVIKKDVPFRSDFEAAMIGDLRANLPAAMLKAMQSAKRS